MERCAITVRGQVQGVGFRPFVFRLASQLQLGGAVRNQAGDVHIDVEGESHSLARFLDELTTGAPPLAEIEQLICRRQPLAGARRFTIEPSRTGQHPQVFITPDVATCDECLAEMRDPADRRFGYPFLNCTNCGPRLTIVTAAPYDRQNTTMAGFVMCDQCRAEYENPADRRFHAQPIACPRCGPQLSLRAADGTALVAGDPVEEFARQLAAGRIGALKGLGGYHLVCHAADDRAVRELRRRKHRDEKPLAMLVQDVTAAESLCQVEPAERALLLSPARPIVLLRRQAAAGVADEVAPGNPRLGLMLPYTPLHHLLSAAVAGPLVMTSGNRSDEPIAIDDDDARRRLGDIADVFLTHNRPIRVRADDSVTSVIDGVALPLRRSRGYAPQPVRLAAECSQPVLAVGGQLKVAFALAAGRQAFLSHHLGDLDDWAAYQAFQRDIALYEDLLQIRPRCIAHDLHPDYQSTAYALARSRREALPLVAVQHHHAHLASCLAEHGLDGPAIGVIFDGTGYGTDGAIWGGEFLVGDRRQFRRAGHLRYVSMPGGQLAIREPWRMALAQVIDAGCDAGPLAERIAASQRRTIERMLARGLNCPLTSSAGRLFDAVAALCGLRDRCTYEGQAAMTLQWQASEVEPDGVYPFDLQQPGASNSPGDPRRPLVVDTRPLVRAVVADVIGGVDPRAIARRFHSTLVEVIVHTCRQIGEQTGLARVALSGGVFNNALLTSETCARLRSDGFEVYRHRRVPAGDGGLSLGQLAVAAARQAARTPERSPACA